MARRPRNVVTGVNETVAGIRRVQRRGLSIFGAALFQEAEKIMAVSKTLTPVVTGALRASGHVSLPQESLGVVFVELGYGGSAAPYALSVHENPRAGKTGGVGPPPRNFPYPRTKSGSPTWSTHPKGQWKYLEQPFNAAVPGLQQRLQAFINSRVRRIR